MDPTQPYMPPGASAPAAADPAPPPRPWRRPRVWPVYTSLLLAMFGGTIVQAIVAIPLMMAAYRGELDRAELPDKFMEFVSTPMGMILLATPIQLAFLAAAIIPPIAIAWYNQRGAPADTPSIRKSVWVQLGLTAPKASVWSYPVIVLGVLTPALAGVALSSVLLRQAGVDASDSPIYENMTREMAIPFTTFIALVPAVCEELFFRGFAQRRITRRFGPMLAIWQATMLFAIVHLAPAQVMFVIPIGAWLGYVAWRTDSIWLTIVSHAVVNASWNVWMILSIDPAAPVAQPWIMGLIVVALISFGVSIWLLERNGVGARADRPPKRIPTAQPTVIEATLAPPIVLASLAEPDPPEPTG